MGTWGTGREPAAEWECRGRDGNQGAEWECRERDGNQGPNGNVGDGTATSGRMGM